MKPGDVIRVGGAGARVMATDRERSTLEVDADISWDEDEAVNYAYDGGGPDVGA